MVTYYTGDPTDDNSQLVCTATQYSGAGVVLYESQAEFSLRVAPAAVGWVLSTGDIIGIILGILILIILLLLCCCFFFFYRKRQAEKGSHFENNIFIGKEGEGFVKVDERKVYKENSGYDNKASATETAVLIRTDGASGKRKNSTSSSSSSSSSDDSKKHVKVDNNHLATNIIYNLNDANSHFNKYNNNLKQTNIDKYNHSQTIIGRADNTYVKDSNTVEKTCTREESQMNTQYFEHTYSFSKERDVFEQNNETFVGIENVCETEVVHNNDRTDDDFITAKKLSSSSSSASSSSAKSKQSSVVDLVVESIQEAGNKFNMDSQNNVYVASNIGNTVHINKEQELKQKSENIKTSSFGHFDKNKSKKRVTSILKKDKDWRNNLSNIAEERLSQIASMEDLRKSLEDLQKSQENLQKSQDNLEQTGQTKYMYSNVPSVFVSKVDTTKFNSSSTDNSEAPSKRGSIQVETIIEETHEEIVNNITTTTTEEKNYRRYNDEHYYIGNSEYAEVVQEHVNGKFEDDLGYFTEKSNEKITVNPKIWKVEEIASLTETQSIFSTSGIGRRAETPLRLPDTPQDDSFKHNYIQEWISTENVAAEFSPSSNPEYVNKFEFSDQKDKTAEQSKSISLDMTDKSDIEELDKSDESCIVTNEYARKPSVESSKSSNTFEHDQDHFIDNLESRKQEQVKYATKFTNQKNVLQHIAEYHKLKQENLKQTNQQQSNLYENTNVTHTSYNSNTTNNIFVPHSRTDFHTNNINGYEKDEVHETTVVSYAPAEKEDKHSSGFNINFSKSPSITTSEKSTRTTGSSKNKVDLSADTTFLNNGKRSIYQITQNEITLFSKQPEGRIKIIHRPIVNTTARTMIKSMPDLSVNHIDIESPEEEASDKGETENCTSGHLHMTNVGLLQQSLPMKQVYLFPH